MKCKLTNYYDWRIIMEIKAIGQFIKTIRKSKNITQKELAEKLNISSQAVSRWENGDSLPDTLLLLDLSEKLGISVDLILRAGNPVCDLKQAEKFNVLDVPKGFEAMEDVKKYFGEKSLFYIGMIQGVSNIMNFDFEESLISNREALYLEVIISAANMGYYIDTEEVEELFKDNYESYKIIKSYNNEYWQKILEYNLLKNS